jgi:hypothetical protein
VSNYYLYRINTSYDGFRPSSIPERMQRGAILYNWGSYVQSLERGDIILTYFTGPGCKAGVYAVAVVRNVKISTRHENVRGHLLAYSTDDRHPLIAVGADNGFFDGVRTRIRGAELVVPDAFEAQAYDLLRDVPELLDAAAKRNVLLPGAEPYPVQGLKDVPLIDTESDFSATLIDRQLIAAYWIRPSQASWISEPPLWLSYISSVFGKFKSGDLSRLDYLANALASQVNEAVAEPQEVFGAVIGVPLNEQKRHDGEIDRVSELAKALAAKIGVPVSEALRLTGGVSRRLYKLDGKGTERFCTDYLANLTVRRTECLAECVRNEKDILLVDDVYTDGVTTEIIAEAVKEEFQSGESQVRIATLGVMAKHNNMDDDLISSWR